MSQVPFLGPTYAGRSSSIDASRCVNFYVEMNPPGSKTPLALFGTPGSKFVGAAPTSPVRALYPFAGKKYVVAGNGLYSAEASLLMSLRLGTLNTAFGRVSIANNGTASSGVGGDQIIIVDGVNGYIYNVVSGAFTTISTAGGFPAHPTNVAYLDGYFIVTDGSMSYWVSDLYDGLTWNVLTVSPVQAASDNIQAVMNLHQQLWIIKQYSTEVWYDAGTPTSTGSPFARMPGAVIDYGTPAPFSVARGNNSLFWLAYQRQEDVGVLIGVVELNGYQPTIISPPSIVHRIRQLTTLSDAFGFCYSWEGHTFYVLTFPTDDVTLVYDTATQMWHEWSTVVPVTSVSFGLDDSISVPFGTPSPSALSLQPYSVHRHLSSCYAYFNDRHYVGDYRSNKIFELRGDYYLDDLLPIASFRTTQPLWDQSDQRNVVLHKLQVDAEVGVGNDDIALLPGDASLADGSVTADGSTGAGSMIQLVGTNDPQAILSWSDDNGNSWSSDYYASMGKATEYHKRLIWRRLGYSRNRIFRFAIQAGVKRTVIGASMRAT